MSENKNIYLKLLELQKRIKPILKENNNPFFNSKYADVNDIIGELKPHLNELGLVLIQPIVVLDGKNIIGTRLIDSESGEMIDAGMFLPDNLEPQKLGSAITYYRRYAIQSLCLLQAEDDDGNKTVNVNKASDNVPQLQYPNVPERRVDYVKKIQETTKSMEKNIGEGCQKCGLGVYVMSKNQKLYCSNKCWLTDKADEDTKDGYNSHLDLTREQQEVMPF